MCWFEEGAGRELDLELLRMLRECAATADRLLELLERDREDMSGCVNGELLAEYQRGAGEAVRMVRAIKACVCQLQAAE